MDPLTLFALANGAVSAVKAGCKLYKDIKGAAGEVKGVLQDLDDQFHKLYPPEKPPTVAQKNAYIEEKTRVVELNKKANAGAHTGIYTEIGEHLGTYYDNFYKCMAVFEEEERRAKTELYTGDSSLGKRALQRVLMRKQLEQMSVDLRELMIYQCPSELGTLYTEVEEMMKQMGKEQAALVSQQMRKQHVFEMRRKAKLDHLREQAIYGSVVVIMILVFMFMMMYVIHDRQQKYPHLGDEWIPKSEEQRKLDLIPKHWVGR